MTKKSWQVLLSFFLMISILFSATIPSAVKAETVTPQETMATIIDNYLASKSSPLAGYGSVFVAKGQLYNVDPRLIVAIAGAESSFAKARCQSWNSVDIHNAWGYMYWPGGTRTCKPFDNWDQAIDVVSWQIGASSLYLRAGKTTIPSIGELYCGPGCTNWVNNVTLFFTQMGGNPSSLTFPGYALPSTITITPQGAGFEFTGLGGWVEIHTQNTVSCSTDSNKAIYTRTRTPPYTNDVDWVRWRPTIITSGWYRVEAYIPNYTHGTAVTTQARYQITYANGQNTVVVNQNNNLCSWISLGTYWFNSGTSGFVYMGDYTGDNPFRLIAADGMRFVPIASEDTTPPTGNVDLPANGTTISPSTVNFTAQASDNVGVDHVEFHVYYDGSWHLVNTDTTAPYATTWSVPAGLAPQQLIFTIHVIDLAGNRTMDPGGYHYVQLNAGSSGANIVSMARLDIGMPYNAERRPYCGSYGPWSSQKGVCTDLVIDAYLKGTGGNGTSGICGASTYSAMGNSVGGVNLEALVRADGRANPGRYRWNSARNADDLRIYFQQKQIYLNKNTAWQVGDIAFFDWEGDGSTSHVGVVSAIDGNSKPTSIIHAPGGGTSCDHQNDNACETSASFMSSRWSAVQGHGRLKSQTGLLDFAGMDVEPIAEQQINTFTGNYLEISVNQPDPLTLQMTLRDEQGRYRSGYPNEELFGNITDAAIPYLPYADYEQNTEEQILQYYAPTAENFTLEFLGGANISYSFNIRTYQGSTLTSQQTFTQTISTGENQALTFQLFSQDGALIIAASQPQITDHIQFPDRIVLTSTGIDPIDLDWVLTETTGLVPSGIIIATITPLISREGVVLGIKSFIPTAPTLGAGQTIHQQAFIELSPGNIGNIYQGAIILESTSGKKIAVPIEITLINHPVFLPAISR